jgi:hypothetical protein
MTRDGQRQPAERLGPGFALTRAEAGTGGAIGFLHRFQA